MKAFKPNASVQIVEGPLRGVSGRIDDVQGVEVAITVQSLPPRLERSYVPGEVVRAKIVECRVTE